MQLMSEDEKQRKGLSAEERAQIMFLLRALVVIVLMVILAALGMGALVTFVL